MFTKESKLKRFDFILFFTAVALSIYGLIIVKSATMSLPGGSAKYLTTQISAFILGLIFILILIVIDYDIYGSLYVPIYIISNAVLIAVLIFGYGSEEWGNVRSWIKIGPVRFQPSEIAKFGIIISLAKYLDINKENINNPLVLSKILAFALFPVVLILMQPDIGTALVFIFFIVVMIFIAGINYKYVAAVLAFGLILLLIGFGVFLYIMQDYNIGDNYLLDRILTFLDPQLDPDYRGYQVIQSKTAIGSGLVFGRGLYEGVQNQFSWLPTKETDFIFAVIGEELGLVGGLFLIGLYALLLYRLIRIAKNTTNTFGSLIVSGIASMIFFHILENIGMTMGLLPVTGIPLPFISYGGTFMLVNMISIGLALSVGLKKNRFDLNIL